MSTGVLVSFFEFEIGQIVMFIGLLKMTVIFGS